MGRRISLPERVAARARRHGDVGAAWVRRLPDIAADLEARWGIRIGETLRGGTAAYVARAVTAGGEDVVVKIGMPSQIDGELAFVRAVECYTLAGGKGCARLLAHDGEHSALLIESLGPNLDSLKVPLRRELAIIAATVQAMWVPVPEQTTLPTAPEKVDGLVSFIAGAWEALGQPCAERTIKVVRSFAAERAAAFDRRTAVLVHGDAHGWNTLQAGDDVFKLVDPEGVISEPAHDLGIPMREIRERELSGDALAAGHDYAWLLSECVGVDARAIWQWGLIERVSTGLLLMQIRYPEGPEMLRIADRWSESPEFSLSASFDVEMFRDRAAPPPRRTP